MVFYTDAIPGLFYANLLYGLLELIIAIMTALKIRRGSESMFAYTLLGFVFLQSIQSICNSFVNISFKQEPYGVVPNVMLYLVTSFLFQISGL